MDVVLTLLRNRAARCYPAVYFLLDKGVDVHVVGKDGMTLLHLAAALYEEEDALSTVELLVHAGCNSSSLNSVEETPLHIAARHGHLSVIDYLLSLDMAFPRDLLLATSSGDSRKTPVIRYLVDRDADVSVATTDGDTPLHLLLARGGEMDRLESAKILINGGCDPRARNLAGKTPLHTAAGRGFVTILKYLCLQGVPLPHDILRSSTPATIRFLLGKGMDAMCSISIDDDKELMHRALHPQQFDSDEEDCLECVRILVGLGWDSSLRNSSGETPMHVAARHGQIAVIKHLLLQSAPLPLDILLVAITPPLKDFWDAGCAVQLTRFLISEGASVNITAPNGDISLHLALRCNFTPDMHRYDLRESWKLVEILLKHGSDPTARNVHGQTPFDLAEARGYFFKENFLRLVRNSRTQPQPRDSTSGKTLFSNH